MAQLQGLCLSRIFLASTAPELTIPQLGILPPVGTIMASFLSPCEADVNVIFSKERLPDILVKISAAPSHSLSFSPALGFHGNDLYQVSTPDIL